MKKVKKKKIVEKVVKVILEVKNKLNKEANQGKNPIKYLKVLIHRVQENQKIMIVRIKIKILMDKIYKIKKKMN